jgi:hypothetical protein
MVVCLHGVPKRIVSNKGTQFTLKLWQILHETTDTHLNLSTAYHPHTDGHTKRVNQMLKDMLRVCALQNGRSWKKNLLYTEFSYKNSYQASLKMSSKSEDVAI